jgi:outer membrane protein OmpA-like peptidoglycan-associated protein
MIGAKFISMGKEPMFSTNTGLATTALLEQSCKSDRKTSCKSSIAGRLHTLSAVNLWSSKAVLCSMAIMMSSSVYAQQAEEGEEEESPAPAVELIEGQSNEQEIADTPKDFEPKFYVGLGAGVSDLDPDTSEAPEVTLTDGSQTGFQIAIGADLNKWFSAEIHAADLGSAELSNGGDISYREYGLSGLVYGGKNRGNYNRSGLTFFGRGGLGYLSNDATAGVQYDKQEGVHIILGAGAEYATRQGIALRAEGMVFDTDVSYLQLGLLYRFGSAPAVKWPFGFGGFGKGAGKRKSFRMAKPLPGDFDGDGVGDSDDLCEKTPSGQPIDEQGCPVFSGVIEGLNFISGSADLTDEAKVILDELAETLLAYPDLRIRVSAHTDSRGDDQENMLLSRRRALTVSKHLVAAGVSKFRLEAVSYGETKPIASNDTRDGRMQNRRVELIAVP